MRPNKCTPRGRISLRHRLRAFFTGAVQAPTCSFFVLGIGLDLASVLGFMVFFKTRGWFKPIL
jgi:hypothetical protein